MPKSRFNLDVLLSHAEELDELQTTEYNNKVDNADESELFEPDNEEEEEAPLYNSIISKRNGREKLRALCNFYPEELFELWEIIKPNVLSAQNRGKKPKYGGLDRFIIVLSHLKHAQTFKKFGLDFDLDETSACTMFHNSVAVIDKPLKKKLRRLTPMSDLRAEKQIFESLKSVLLVTDVHFHKSNRPAGRFSDVKHYFSGKHHQYGLKVATAHNPNGFVSMYPSIMQVASMISISSVNMLPYTRECFSSKMMSMN